LKPCTPNFKKIAKVITPRRLELKMAYAVQELSFVKKTLLLSNLRFRKAYPTRKVNSLYFDNSTFSAIEDSLSGTSNRTKIRLRWYGDLDKAIKPVLEFKLKQGQLSWKKLYSTSLKLNPNPDNWMDAFTCISNDLGEQTIRNVLPSTHSIPISLISYTREYYESFGGLIRATIDQDLTYRDQTLSLRPNFKIKRKSSNKLILELKLAKQNLNSLGNITHHLKFIPQRFSKYCESALQHQGKWR
jgi:hypothetical protein